MNWVILTSLIFGLLFGLLPGQAHSMRLQTHASTMPALTSPIIDHIQTDPNNAALQVASTISSTTYLPFINRAPALIAGYVYSGNLPLANTPVALVSIWTSMMHPPVIVITTTHTDSSGYYAFSNITGTLGLELYRVQLNLDRTPGRAATTVSSWFTYEAGTWLQLPPLYADVNLRLIAPADGATVNLPVTFEWTSNVRDVSYYELYAYTGPCCASFNAGTATRITLTKDSPNIWLVNGAHPMWVRAISPGGFTDSEVIYVTFNMP